MIKVIDALRDWMIEYVKHRNMIMRNLVSVSPSEDSIRMKYSDREVMVLIRPQVSDFPAILKSFGKGSHVTIVVLNNKNNLDSLLNQWHQLVDYRFLTVYFVNPNSVLDKKWIIAPYTHHKICDDSSLAQGLQSMFETVEPIEAQELLGQVV